MPSTDDFVQTTIPELAGQSGNVRLRLTNMPILHSASRDCMKYVDEANSDFYIFLSVAMLGKAKAQEKTKFLFLTTYYCRQCEAALKGQLEEKHLFKFVQVRCW